MKDYKWIIVRDNKLNVEFRCDYVDFHRHLINQGERVSVFGGGLFRIDSDNAEIKLYDSSGDYGYVKDESLFKKCYESMIEAFKDFYYYKYNEEIDMDKYSIVWIDEGYEKHVLKK